MRHTILILLLAFLLSFSAFAQRIGYNILLDEPNPKAYISPIAFYMETYNFQEYDSYYSEWYDKPDLKLGAGVDAYYRLSDRLAFQGTVLAMGTLELPGVFLQFQPMLILSLSNQQYWIYKPLVLESRLVYSGYNYNQYENTYFRVKIKSDNRHNLRLGVNYEYPGSKIVIWDQWTTDYFSGAAHIFAGYSFAHSYNAVVQVTSPDYYAGNYKLFDWYEFSADLLYDLNLGPGIRLNGEFTASWFNFYFNVTRLGSHTQGSLFIAVPFVLNPEN